MAKELTLNDLELPVYCNTREVFAGLNVTDLVKAAILGQLNTLIIGGDTGTGKSQLASDIYNTYFMGNKKEGGFGVSMRAHSDINIYEEIFTRLNITRAQRELTDNLEAMVFFVDEINRAPPVSQNQFFGLGDGKMNYGGKFIPIGRDGYHILIATANLGNGEFSGTFETDKAMLNRLHFCLDLDYGPFQPTIEDARIIRKRSANPNIVDSPRRDITDKIISASKKIAEKTRSPDLETTAVLDYLQFGLRNCQKYGIKERIWPIGCVECQHNKTGNALCSLIKAPPQRTVEVIRKYAASLEYLAKLKNPHLNIEPFEFVFKAFELTGAYKYLLNQSKLNEQLQQNQKVMAQVVEGLREDYLLNRDFILTSYEQALKNRQIINRFFIMDEQLGNYDLLRHPRGVKKIEPFHDQREIGLAYISEILSLIIKENEHNLK